MSKSEAVSGALFAVVGAFMMFEAFSLAYLIEGVPGPGFLPRWIAGGLIATGLFIVVRALHGRTTAEERPAWPRASGWRRVALVLGALAVSLIVLTKLGFLVTTALFVAVVIYGLGVRSWLMIATVPLGAAAVLYLVFAVWLSVPLPKGILAGFE